MIDNLPYFISIIFGLTSLATLVLFYRTIKKSSNESIRNKSLPILIGLIIWLLIQAILSFNSVYNKNTNDFPPKIFLFGILPTLVSITLLFLTKTGRIFIDSLPLPNITFTNIVRIPVELVLYWLFLNGAVPELMTFEGRNFDILAGITAPFIGYFGYKLNKINNRYILIWNFICLTLLMNIVVNAFLSAPSPLQQFAFEQPNIAILYFPFSWLPTFIVPIILLGHFISIRQLTLKNSNNSVI